MLGHVTVQTLHTEISLFQHLSQLVHLYLRIAENQAELRLIVFQQADAGGILVLALHPVISLGHQRDGQLLGRYPHQPGILLELIGDVQDGLGHGGGEQRRLMGVGNLAQYQLHVLPEAHVQHLVRLVQHYHVHVVKLDGAAAHMIHHAARSAHHDLHVLQPPDLLADVLSAVDGQHLDAVHEFGDVADLLRGLHGKLPGGAEDDGLELAQVRVYLLQGGDGEGRRLARARLGLSDDVLAVQQIGDGLHLDGRQLLEAHLPHGPHDALVQKGLDGGQAGGIRGLSLAAVCPCLRLHALCALFRRRRYCLHCLFCLLDLRRELFRLPLVGLFRFLRFVRPRLFFRVFLPDSFLLSGHGAFPALRQLLRPIPIRLSGRLRCLCPLFCLCSLLHPCRLILTLRQLLLRRQSLRRRIVPFVHSEPT